MLLLFTRLVWSLPVALAMAELGSALPDEGGYVGLVRRAFGSLWAFQASWWSWITPSWTWPSTRAVRRLSQVLVAGHFHALTLSAGAGLHLDAHRAQRGGRLRGAALLGVGALASVVAFTAMALARAEHAPWLPGPPTTTARSRGTGWGSP